MKRRIIIADINSRCADGVLTGHGLAVARNYAALSDEKTDIIVAGGPAYAPHFPHALILDYDADAALSARENKRRNLHNIRQLFRLCPHDTIIFQSCAVATTFLGIALYKPKTCRVLMIQYNTMGLDSFLKRALYRLAKAHIRGIICPEPAIGQAFGLPFCLVPDYIYTAPEKPQPTKSYHEKKYDFCMLGIISRDKGMIEAAAKLAGSPYRVLLAGRPADAAVEQELRAIGSTAENIEMHLRYIGNEEYVNFIRNSRYCILNYSGAYSEHSSGVVFDMLFNGVPVVGRRCRALAFIEDFGIGELVERIETWEPRPLLDEEYHLHLCRRIQEYYRTHCAHREKLLTFIRGEN